MDPSAPSQPTRAPRAALLVALLTACAGPSTPGARSADAVTARDEATPGDEERPEASRTGPTSADAPPPPGGYACVVQHVFGPRGDAAAGRVAMEQRYDFDASGRLVAEREIFHDMGGASRGLRYEHDATGRLTGAAPVGPQSAMRVTYVPAEDPSRQIAQRVEREGMEPERVVWTYDERGRVTERAETVTLPAPPGGAESQRTVTDRCLWAASGLPAASEHEHQRDTYAYDEAGRVTAVSVTPEGARSEGDAEATVDQVVRGEDGVVERHGAPDAPGYRRYLGRCEDLFFRPCSPAFSPPPPSGTAPPRLPEL